MTGRRVRRRSTGTAVDPYLPGHGNAGYAVSRYDLDLDYRVASNRLAARAAAARDRHARPSTGSASTSPGCGSPR